jgi:hypothetical protein
MPNCVYSSTWYSGSILVPCSYLSNPVDTHPQHVDSTKLSKQSRVIDLEELDIYNTVLQFCIETWPDAGIFGPGMADRHYLAPVGMVQNYSYVEYDGVRYGAFEHTSGKGYCYGYVEGRYPVRIERVLHIAFPGAHGMQDICILVRPFQPPSIEPHFPWDAWYVFLFNSNLYLHVV